MACKALSKTSHVVQYFPNLRAVVIRTRCCMGTRMQLSTSSIGTSSHQDKKLSDKQWSENRLGPFAKSDPKFPLPGNMGLVVEKEETQNPLRTKSLIDALLEVPSDESHKMEVMGCFLENMVEMEENITGQAAKSSEQEPKITKQQDATVECSIQTCPTFLHRGFMELFPDKKMKPTELTIINISQYTKHDMSTWSMEVEEEREFSIKNFVESAKEICANLSSAGYWADFIDPSSGTAFFGPHTNTTLFETDDRFNHLGFNILDLGCCKVISHHLWGTRVFVGSIFTNAPIDSDILGKALQQ